LAGSVLLATAASRGHNKFSFFLHTFFRRLLLSCTMFHSILVPLDGSTLAEQALPIAAAVAERNAALLHLVVVHPWGPPEDAPFPETIPDRESREAEGAYLSRMVPAVASTHHVTVCEAVLDGATGPALVEFARKRNVDLVVASTHGRGALSRFVLGGVAHHLVWELRASVLLLKPQAATVPPPFGGFMRVLFATDGSVQAEAALESAMALAAGAGATVTLFEVVLPSARGGAELEHRRAEAERHLAALVPHISRRGIGADIAATVAVNPAAAILTQAERSDADLIVLTTRERRPVERVLFGSVADTVVHHAAVPVLVCHTAA
jgi:nucleotide-binding universal stress UspA family protein